MEKDTDTILEELEKSWREFEQAAHQLFFSGNLPPLVQTKEAESRKGEGEGEGEGESPQQSQPDQ